MRVFGVSGRAVGVRESVTVWVGVGVRLCMCVVHVCHVWLRIPVTTLHSSKPPAYGLPNLLRPLGLHYNPPSTLASCFLLSPSLPTLRAYQMGPLSSHKVLSCQIIRHSHWPVHCPLYNRCRALQTSQLWFPLFFLQQVPLVLNCTCPAKSQAYLDHFCTCPCSQSVKTSG